MKFSTCIGNKSTRAYLDYVNSECFKRGVKDFAPNARATLKEIVFLGVSFINAGKAIRIETLGEDYFYFSFDKNK